MFNVLPTIQTASVSHELNLDVRYIVEPADPSTGWPETVEILSVSFRGVRIPLSTQLHDAIRDELRENLH